MTLQRQKAAAPTATQSNIERNEAYHKSQNWSSEKTREQLGRILIALQTPLRLRQQKELWEIFERKLRQYLDLRDCGVTI